MQPVKPTRNGFVESFNGRFRDECLNEHRFTSLSEARRIIGAWALRQRGAPAQPPWPRHAIQLCPTAFWSPVSASRSLRTAYGFLRPAARRQQRPEHDTNRNTHTLSGAASGGGQSPHLAGGRGTFAPELTVGDGQALGLRREGTWLGLSLVSRRLGNQVTICRNKTPRKLLIPANPGCTSLYG